MELNPLTAISPVDGRYREAVEPLGAYFSESALIRYRILVEIEYFMALCRIPLPELRGIDPGVFEKLKSLFTGFTLEDARRVKEIEKETNHDVKSVEYFIKERLKGSGCEAFMEFIHFGLTSQDVNNCAIPLMMRDAYDKIISPELEKTVAMLESLAYDLKDLPMLARTHGQPASPTTMGKEIFVFVERIKEQKRLLDSIPFTGKFGGATGNFNAHHAAYPEIDWIGFADRFLVESLGILRQKTTTQIEHYDHMAAFFDAFKRINTILTDMCRDFWTYVSMNYFKQKVIAKEVGSSTMPHKVNPIDFENAEGNLGLANALFTHLSANLPISRLQRDLTDSTVTRNIGVPFAHTMIALSSIRRGLGKLEANHAAMNADLDDNWAVISEAIQTLLRRHGYPKPYEALKDLTRGGHVDEKGIRRFIDGLDVKDDIKTALHQLTPRNYIGIIDF